MRISNNSFIRKTYKRDYEQVYPYNVIWGKDDKAINQGFILSGLLPHGGGIDYTWDIVVNHRTGRVYAYNSYHAMDDMGGYCHIYDFTAVYIFNGENAYETCSVCGGNKERDISEYPALLERFGREKIVCNYCKGEGKIELPTVTLERLEFNHSRPRACCGDGLREHLESILDGYTMEWARNKR